MQDVCVARVTPEIVEISHPRRDVFYFGSVFSARFFRGPQESVAHILGISPRPNLRLAGTPGAASSAAAAHLVSDRVY